MEVLLITLLLLYNAWLVVYILHGRKNSNKVEVEKKPPAKPPKESDEIVGKSLFRMENRTPISSKREPNTATILEGEDVTDIAITFADTKEETPPARLPDDKIDEAFDDIRITDVPVKYENEEDERPVRRLATGASFEEIGQAVNVADNPNSTANERKSAGEVFSEMKDSEFYAKLIANNLEREKRIMGLMDEYSNKYVSGEGKEIGKVVQPHSIPEIPADISGFNIRDFV